MLKKSWALPLLIALAFFAGPAAAAGRTLHWKSLDVAARLDSDGRLHVVETQTMVFDGDWNGGERRFNLRGSQTVTLASLEEIDPATGARTTYAEAEPVVRERWAWHSPSVLRWRARDMDAPPFQNTVKTFVLTYSMTNILMRRGDRYRLSHDFAFPDRAGVIERFTLDFETDPAWKAEVGIPSDIVVENMQPGSGYVLNIPLAYSGSSTPMATDLSAPVEVELRDEVAPGAKAPVRRAFGYLLLLVIAGFATQYLLGERSRGRFAAIDPVSSIDQAWLQEQLLSRHAEIVGAAWDEKTGGAEVAALLARLAVEGKIVTRVEQKKQLIGTRSVLHIQKTCDYDDLDMHARALLRALLRGSESTDTDRVRKAYKKVGFNPVAYIEDYIQRRMPWSTVKGPENFPWKVVGIGAAAYAAAILITALFSSGDDALMLFGWGLTSTIATALLVLGARSSRRDIRFPLAGMLKFALPAAFYFWLASGVFFGIRNVRVPAVLAIASLVALIFWIVFRVAATVGQEERIAVRKKLFAARRWLVAELRQPEPRLDDTWFPYLLAFGLGKNVDRWFRAFGGESAAGVTSSLSRSSMSSSSSWSGSSGPSWSGGGGAFGGAGASGSWSVAASAMAAGISSPASSGSSSGGSSSSGSSSSSSSSGGSSGGGGGGGW